MSSIAVEMSVIEFKYWQSDFISRILFLTIFIYFYLAFLVIIAESEQ